MIRRTAWCAALAAAVLAACAADKPPPKAPVESELRAQWAADDPGKALEAVKDPALRESLRRWFADRAREAAGRSMKLAVGSVATAEEIGIGGGLSIVRLFAVYHEYDESRFVSRLAGIEAVGGRIGTEYRRTVGGTGVAFVSIKFTELNRVILDTWRFEKSDPPCCPSRRGETGYQFSPSSLDPLQ